MDRMRSRVFTVIALLTTFMFCNGPMSAQNLTQVQRPSPEARALVRELPSRNFGDGFVELLQRRLIDGLPERYGMAPEDAKRLVDEILVPDFKAQLPELETTLAGIWSARFTDFEIHELLEFARNRSPERQEQFLATPLGKKYLTQRAAINQANGQAGSEWAERISLLSFKKNAATVEAMGIDPVTGRKLEKADSR